MSSVISLKKQDSFKYTKEPELISRKSKSIDNSRKEKSPDFKINHKEQKNGNSFSLANLFPSEKSNNKIYNRNEKS